MEMVAIGVGQDSSHERGHSYHHTQGYLTGEALLAGHVDQIGAGTGQQLLGEDYCGSYYGHFSVSEEDQDFLHSVKESEKVRKCKLTMIAVTIILNTYLPTPL